MSTEFDRTPRKAEGSSRDAGEHLARSGSTKALKHAIFTAAAMAGPEGLTVKEFSDELAEQGHPVHHGRVSSAFSTMHEAGFLARLTERRGRYETYVLSSVVNGRPTREHASVARKKREDQIKQAVDQVEALYGPKYRAPAEVRHLIALVDPRKETPNP